MYILYSRNETLIPSFRFRVFWNIFKIRRESFDTRRLSTRATYATVISCRFGLIGPTDMKNSGDERAVDHFCVPNLARTHFIALPPSQSQSQSQSQLRVALPPHANMLGHGDVTSGVSFFAACTYHWRARGEEQEWQRKERKKKGKERERDRLARLRCSRRCSVYVYVTWSHTHGRCDRGVYVGRGEGCEVRFVECRRR